MGGKEEGQHEVPPHAERVDGFWKICGSPGHETRCLRGLARREQINLGWTPQGRNLMKNMGIKVPVRDQLEPRGCVRLYVFLRGNEGGQDAELTLVEKKNDPLGPLEESPFPEAPFLPDVNQRRSVVNPPQNRCLARQCEEDFRQENPQNTKLPHTKERCILTQV
jgi:hypothetical protein